MVSFRNPARKRRVVVLRSAAWACFTFAVFVVTAAINAPEVRDRIRPELISPEKGAAFTAAVDLRTRKFYTLRGPAVGQTPLGRLTLFEDGTALGPEDSLHNAIRSKGAGAYSYWDRTLYFSTSDGTDPRNNGREYTFHAQLALKPALGSLGAFAAIGGFLCLGLSLRSGPPARLGVARSPGQRLRSLVETAVLATRPGAMPETVYWTLFGVLLVWGVFVRSVWTYAYGLPDVTPDTLHYIIPAADDPWRPFSEMRTAGVPGLLVLSVGVAGPIGILLAHNLLWLASTLAVTLALRTHLQAPALSLLVLAYLVLSAKNLVQEYFLMSEHLSRVLYVGYFALALYLLRHPASRWAAVGMAALVFANIITKPSAAVLIVATLLLLLGALGLAIHPEARRRVAVNAAIFLFLVLGGLLGYMAAYQGKYGAFALSGFQGWNLFSHTGHLIKLDGGIHPELKAELREFMPLYIEKYAGSGRFHPNWLVYGSTDPDLDADFGKRSPAASIVRYVANQPGGTLLARVDRVFLELALEGIRTHPVEYARYAAFQMYVLFQDGYSFDYGLPAPSMATLDRHTAGTGLFTGYFLREGRDLEGRLIGAKVRSCDENWFVRKFCRALSSEEWYRRYADRSLLPLLSSVDGLQDRLSAPVRYVFERLPALALLLTPLLIVPVRPSLRARRILAAVALLALVLLGYGLFLGLLNVAEPRRFLSNVQDLVVFMLAGVVICGFLAVRRLALLAARRTTARRTNTRHHA